MEVFVILSLNSTNCWNLIYKWSLKNSRYYYTIIILYIGARIIASHTILIFGRRKKWSSKAVKTFWLFNRNEKIWATSNNSQMSIDFLLRRRKGRPLIPYLLILLLLQSSALINLVKSQMSLRHVKSPTYLDF